jgi:hypothetical protein
LQARKRRYLPSLEKRQQQGNTKVATNFSPNPGDHIMNSVFQSQDSLMDNSHGAAALLDSFHGKAQGENFAGNHSFTHEESV